MLSLRVSPSLASIRTVGEIPPRIIADDTTGTNKDLVDLQFPEGGRAAWCTVIGGALVQFCGFGYLSSFGVYQDFYTRHYLTNESASAISWIGSVNAFLVTSLCLVSGILYDRGYFYHLMIGGSLLQVFALFMLSLAQPGQYYQIFIAQGVGLGLAQGILYIPSMAAVSHYFHLHRTLAMSLVASGSSLGSIIHPIMLNNLFIRGVGFSDGVRISAAFVTALLVIACSLVRTRLKPPRNPPNHMSVGKGIVQDTPFCIMCIAFLLFNAAFYYVPFYLQLDSFRHGNSETFSFYSLSMMNAGGMIGRLSAGFIAPYIGVPNLLIIATAASGILILGTIGLNGVLSVVILGISYGYFSGIYIAMLSPLMAILTNDLSELGARMGICIAIAGIGSLFGGPVAGALLTAQYKWWQPSLFIGLIALSACALLIVMQVALIRRQKHGAEEEKL